MVAINNNGAFVVAWYDSSNTASTVLRVRKFNTDGTDTGEKVNDTGLDTEAQGITMFNDGSFVIVRQSHSSAGSQGQPVPKGDTWSILVRLYAADGTLILEDLASVGSNGSNTQTVPSVSSDGVSNFVVSWWDMGSP